MSGTIENNVEKSISRIEYFDTLRVIAMFAVIFNHSFGYFSIVKYNQYHNTIIWHIDNILVAFTRFDVPIFFMLSGALLLGNSKTLSLEYLFRKRVPKILIPLFTWDLIYIIAHNYKNGLLLIAKEFVHSIFLARWYAGHLWYLYALIAIYLLSPLLKCFIDRAYEKLLNYALILWAIFSILIPFIHQFVPSVLFANYADLNILSGYLGYFILGYKLANIKKTFNQGILAILFTGGWLITGVAGYFYQNNLQLSNSFFIGFLTPNVVIMPIAMFILIKQLSEKHEIPLKIKHIISNLSNLSFGIYLTHFLFRDLAVLIFEKNPINPILFMIICPVFVFITSYITINLASKVSILSFCITGNKYKKIYSSVM